MKNNLKKVFTAFLNSCKGTLDHRLIFLHIPKCAGTSIQSAIRRHYLSLHPSSAHSLVNLNSQATVKALKIISNTDYPHDTSDDSPILTFREHLLLYFMTQDHIRYVSGHFVFSNIAYQAFHDKYAFITVLRDPMKRYISSYLYNRYKNDRFIINEDIERFILSDFGRSQGYEYVKFLGGLDGSGDYTSSSAIKRAKENLHKFDIVGALEYMENFCTRFEDLFGVRLDVERKNIGPKSDTYTRSIISDEIKRKIVSICEPDYEVYQYAVDNFILNRN